MPDEEQKRDSDRDIIEFRILETDENEDCRKRGYAAHIFINRRDLVSILFEHEKEFARREGNPDDHYPAGGYKGLFPFVLLENLGRTKDKVHEWRTEVLTCDSCGIRSCWSFELTIRYKIERVIWTKFGNPHRGKNSNSHWDYANLGDFVFNYQQYHNALEKLEEQARRIWPDNNGPSRTA